MQPFICTAASLPWGFLHPFCSETLGLSCYQAQNEPLLCSEMAITTFCWSTFKPLVLKFSYKETGAHQVPCSIKNNVHNHSSVWTVYHFTCIAVLVCKKSVTQHTVEGYRVQVAHFGKTMGVLRFMVKLLNLNWAIRANHELIAFHIKMWISYFHHFLNSDFLKQHHMSPKWMSTHCLENEAITVFCS